MTPEARRKVIPFVVTLIALSVVSVVVFTKPAPPATPPAKSGDATASADGEGTEQATTDATDDPDETSVSSAIEGDDLPTEALSLEGLTARAPEDRGETDPMVEQTRLGDLDPDKAVMEVMFRREDAGVDSIILADVYETAEDHRRALKYYADRRAGTPPTVPPPARDVHYRVTGTETLNRGGNSAPIDVAAFSVFQIEINGAGVGLIWPKDPDTGLPMSGAIWAETEPATFETEIVNGDGVAIARFIRRFRMGAAFDLTIENDIINLSGQPLQIKLWQFGPTDVRVDIAKYMDRRAARFGYLEFDQLGIPHVFAGETYLEERRSVVKQDETQLWPFDRNDDGTSESGAAGHELSWFALTNRYFAVAVHPVVDPDGNGSKSFSQIAERIIHEKGIDPADDSNRAVAKKDKLLFTYLISPTHTIAPGATLELDLGVYAGPQDRHLLKGDAMYASLRMNELILYQMSSFCAFCTFQWLAKLLIAFLTLLQTLPIFDWSLAIIGLVVVVRTILHPITKRSQVNMQRFGKVMQAIKPELDKLQKKYGDDPKRMQGEQLRLMREYGVNPLHMLGCLPLFLQTPIWIALYAMLYFAFDLRHEPAFFGVFQWLTGNSWSFLGDLSAPDHFYQLSSPITLFVLPISGLNVLPILMGVMFYIQQKYMSPPPSPTMTADQIRQQKIMKIMMVVMFPIFLYPAPSGLTLYILTSTSIGIIESRYVRAHVNQLDIDPKRRKVVANTAAGGKTPRDAQGRAYAARMKHIEQQKKKKQSGPEKKFKKRK